MPNDKLTCPGSVEILSKMLLDLESYGDRHIVLDMNVSIREAHDRMRNTLIISNHDLFVFDIGFVPMTLSRMRIPLSVVIHEDFVKRNGTVFNRLSERYSVELIPRKGAYPQIIEHLKRGRSVLIFYDPKEYLRIEQKRSIPGIMRETGCSPVFLKYTAFEDRIRKGTTPSRIEYMKHNLRCLMIVLNRKRRKQDVTVGLSVSERFDDYDELIRHKEHIKSMYLI